MRHVPAITQKSKVTFRLGPAIDHDVRRALHRLTRRETIAIATKPNPAPGEVFLRTVRDVVAWACSARRVAIERGPKAVDADGRRLPG